ncbi:ATP-binding cassette domain-containing protein [Pelagibacterium xiamenense]|uniref:ATP-binding cassette domain-containing protein n=1 Tax=Pelagibacterium xiamenense TaxID=2901140 RepID=UPI001E3AF877|nr:ABC transporter ATP-binding protein [Pelagibacterium xiamenense]MCD7059867.1 ABC transporter ATP-binding protein [Pelagibacterium xiamenense]
MSAVLEIENLSVRSGETLLVSNLDLTIGENARVGLIGESGSGKSLTALAATGLLPPGLTATGSVVLDGTEVIGARDADLVPLRGSAVATVFQEPLTALDPLMRMGSQIYQPVLRRRRRAGEPAARADIEAEVRRLLERVALPDPDRIANAYPFEVSGGQRQRVAIAMALACHPKLLIADEPTTALDVTTQAEVLDLMAGLVREEGMALLFIGHDLPVVARIVDDVTVMRRGEVVERGPVGTVLARPEHDYTRTLVAAADAFDRALGAAR